MLPAPEIESALRKAASAHNHPCPRQVLGVRMGLHAGDLLGIGLPQTNKRLCTFTETDGCFADGICAATGCSMGHRTLRLMDEGKVAATFVDTESGRAVRISPAADSRSAALGYAPHARTRWHAQLEAYAIMPADVLLRVIEVALLIDMKTIIGVPGVRVPCTQCGEEILNGREVLRDGIILCRSCASGSYFREVSGMPAK